ncbi:MAG: hypothetical protein DYH18_01255 [Xanthomonadales bacterium PRO7]|nr:hypothetical protein [Xanthomonadales bacterium PRO7]
MRDAGDAAGPVRTGARSGRQHDHTRHEETLMNHALRYVISIIALLAAGIGNADAQNFGPWGDPQSVSAINTAAAEGCPIEGPDGLSLYFASNRTDPAAQGKQDIWRALRASVQSSWGAAENLGAPVNTPEFDYCPTPLTNHGLLFVSSQQTADDCYPGDTPPPPPTGGPSAGDIFASTEDASHNWSTPVNLGCYPNGPNTPGAEFSPSMVTTSAGKFLFFSSDGYPDSQGQDIYMSQVLGDGTVQAGVRVAELSTASDDRMPNVRKDGLEIVFSSNRGGNMDIYVATRASVDAPWSAPQPIANPNINTAGSETRSSLSADGTRLYFGRKVDAADPGDVFVATRALIAAPAALTPAPALSMPLLALLVVLVLACAGFVGLRLGGFDDQQD